MTGFLLHLSGPLQSYGTSGVFNTRDTAGHPTRSAVLGMIAAALGYERGHDLTTMRPIELTVRIDNPGRRISDFHTVGGGRPADQTPPTAAGGRRPRGQGTIVTVRDYLADAAFTVAVTHPDPDWAHRTHHALRHPHWAPHMGRRSCPTNALFLPTGVLRDPVAALDRFPLHRVAPTDDSVTTVPVQFVTEHPPTDGTPSRSTELNDDPSEFRPERPGHHSRTVWTHTRMLDAALCAGRGNLYLNTVAGVDLETAS